MRAALENRDPGDEHEQAARGGVIARRMRQARQLGYEHAAALQIAESDMDIRELARLIDRGCPLRLAADILL